MFIEPYMANVTIFAGTFAPRGWMFCNGQLLAIAQYDALFALIGTTYGGDGQTTFALPDLRSRVAINTGQGGGLSNYIIGQAGGTESITVTTNQLPTHTHSFISLTGNPGASGIAGTANIATGNVPALTTNIQSYDSAGAASLLQSSMNTTTPISGGNQPMEILPPYLAMNYIICVEGIFPSRN
jgi:microcystin-dependent protein